MSVHPRRLSLLRWVLAFAVVSTGLHFTHNFLEIEQYPQSDLISNGVVQAGIVISWPLFTAIGLSGYWLYARQRYARAHLCLLSYGLFGLITLGHFLQGSPDIPPFWYATIFTDTLAGLAILAFTASSAKALRRAPQPS